MNQLEIYYVNVTMDAQSSNTLNDAEIVDTNLENELSDGGSDEVSVLSDEYRDSVEVKETSHLNNKADGKLISVYFKNDQVETQQPRAPRPSFFGAPRKPRRNRGQRKNKKSSGGQTEVDGIDGKANDLATSIDPPKENPSSLRDSKTTNVPANETNQKTDSRRSSQTADSADANLQAPVTDVSAIKRTIERVK